MTIRRHLSQSLHPFPTPSAAIQDHAPTQWDGLGGRTIVRRHYAKSSRKGKSRTHETGAANGAAAKIVGSEPLPRSEVTKRVWAHIKSNNLQNPDNKREIIADEKLQPIFGRSKLDMFQMTKAINEHLK